MTTCVLCKKEPGRFTSSFETADGQTLCEFCLKKKGVWDRCGGDASKIGSYVSNRKMVDLLYRDKAVISSASRQMSETAAATAAAEAAARDDDEVESIIQSIMGGEARKYVVLQVTLKEKLIGTGSRNLSKLERVINAQADKGYRLHTITTASANSVGMASGDRIQATMVFERID